MTRFNIITNTGKFSMQVLDPFINGLRFAIKESPVGSRAVFIDGTDLIHAMSRGSEFNRLCQSAKFVGIYRNYFAEHKLAEDIREALRCR